MNVELSDKVREVLNRVCKWRLILAGKQLGTRPNTDPVCQAVRDQREAIILLRIEVSALSNLLMAQGIVDRSEWCRQLIQEAELLDKSFEKRFPGMRSSNDGIVIYDAQKAAETTEGWPP